MKTLKIYAPLQFGLGDWIEDSEEVYTLAEADIVMSPGGSDIQPEYYNHTPIRGCYHSPKSDAREYDILTRAIEANKFIIGICKGAQWLTVCSGGWLIQDVSGHGGHHEIDTYNDQKFVVNSSHHQMCWPYDLPKNKFKILGWAKSISSRYITEGSVQVKANGIELKDHVLVREPEVIWYPEIRGLAIQSHPEWSSMPDVTSDWFNDEIRRLI